MKKFLKITKALSDKNRVKIIKMLQHKELCVCEIREAIGLAQPTISNHLKILENAELIMSRKEGLWVNYFLNDRSDNPLITVFLESLRDMLEDDSEILSLVKVLPQLNRKDICK
jgi:ArsR family transcriptional regulator